MDPLRGIRNAEASSSNNAAAAGNPARKARRKAKPASQPTVKAGPIPAPYLATAPSPVSTLSQSRIDELAGMRSNMVLPSTFTRPLIQTSSSSPGPSRPTEVQVRRKKYAAGLAAPPAIVPGGSTSIPRVQGAAITAPQNPRRRSADRTGVGGTTQNGPIVVTSPRNGLGTRQRSEERLREMGQVNASSMSLGQLGHILESDPPTTTSGPAGGESVDNAQPGRRRRRVVRGETGLTRRPTVSTREEGMALGLARGASMRRRNVWDDVPESSDPPPAFPFPTTSSTRSPPAFEPNTIRLPYQTTSLEEVSEDSRPRSPPPSFEQAIGLAPHPAPATPSAEAGLSDPSTPIPRPTLSVQIDSLTPTIPQGSASASPAATQYESAASSPVVSEAALTEETREEESLTDMEREDRRMWNADLLAGYSLEERVRREVERRKARVAVDVGSSVRVESSGLAGDREVTDQPDLEQVLDEINRSGGPMSKTYEIVAEQETTAVPTGETAKSGTVEAAQPVLTVARATGYLSTAPTREVLPEQWNPVGSQTQTASGPAVHKSLPPSPSRSPVQQPTTPKTQTFVLPPVVVSPFQPTPGFGRLQPPGESASPTKTARALDTIPGIEPSSTIDITPKETQSDEMSRSGAESDQVVSHSPPTRKLARGKAIRRLSSSPKIAPVRAESIRSKRNVEPQKPLFSSPGYTATQLESMPQLERHHAHRLSAPNVLGGASTTAAANASEARPIRERMKSTPNIHVTPSEEVSGSNVLPPHREAALRRRESALGRIERKNVSLNALPAAIEEDRTDMPPTESMPVKVGTSSADGPLIDLNEPWPAQVPRSPPEDLQTLAATTAELLQLIEDQPVAESSAQAAANAAALQTMKDMLNQQASVSREEPVAPKKKPPPPPPPLRLKRSSGSLARKPSVLMTADSPIIPRILNPPSVSDKSETRERPVAMPTRRPPPLPPQLVLADTPLSSSLAPPLPPRPAPPGFPSRPPLDSRRWSTMSGTNSSVSERDASVVSPPLPECSPRPRPRTSLAVRPRGPRPPPIPSRSWSKVVADVPADPPVRPGSERTMSTPSLAIDPHTPSPPRSISAVDLRSPTSQTRSPEYTDLDVYVARLEGSGREYEGFAHLSSFLGPAKNPAATPAALATLLPAPILVDSRRTNAAGKIKLKLSLLGVRVTKCPICLSQFKGGDKGVMLPICGHVAHEVCARRWFRENRACFVCRVPLAEEE